LHSLSCSCFLKFAHGVTGMDEITLRRAVDPLGVEGSSRIR
jgi:hypothetical protein